MDPFYVTEDGKEVIQGYWFFCPGCHCSHPVHIRGNNKWWFNGNIESPSFMPSLRVIADGYHIGCHSVITDGMINYCSDSDHMLAGQSVAMPDKDWDKHPAWGE